MPNIRILLAYDGTHFAGWQVQKKGERTVQESLETALKRIFCERVIVHGSGRTDSGVHASGQVASCRIPRAFDPQILRYALDQLLPEDIRVRDVQVVDDKFHARMCSVGKRYIYWIARVEPLPFARSFCLYIRAPLDLSRMREAATMLVGTHDFTSFKAADGKTSSAVRTLTRLDIDETDDGFGGLNGPGLLRFTFEGDGFLKQMVRNIMGTLIAIGKGHRPVSDIPRLLSVRDRREAGITAPAHGLFLDEVFY
jgi:tRNA pseudouridine38-40 synthase